MERISKIVLASPLQFLLICAFLKFCLQCYKLMEIVILVMIAGIFTGVLIHRKNQLIKINDRLITIAIYVLLFLLGISVGLNKTILNNIEILGFQALIITLGAVTGSVLVAWLIYKFFFQYQPINTQDEE